MYMGPISKGARNLDFMVIIMRNRNGNLYTLQHIYYNNFEECKLLQNVCKEPFNNSETVAVSISKHAPLLTCVQSSILKLKFL